MAYNYKCGQFDDAFSAKRLGNWAENSRPSRVLRSRRGFYIRQRRPSHHQFNSREFIANDSGHLLSKAKDKICKKTNHWGYPVVSVWDELFQCCDGHSERKSTCEKEFTRSFEDMPRFFRCRSPLAQCANSGCSILDNCNLKYTLELEIQRMRARSPPVVWVYGYHQKRIENQRLRFTGLLAKKLCFVYINPERVLTVLAMRYLHYCPRRNSRAWYWDKEGKSGGFFSIFTELPTVLLDCPPSIQRIVALLRNIISNQLAEAFNTRGIMEVIKMLFITFPCAKGYILDGFPVTLSEGDEYEKEFWPVAAGIYFTSKCCKDSKRGHNPSLVRPHLFLRNNDYLESLVEAAADEFGDTCVKIDETEHLNDRDFEYILTVVKNLIRKYNVAMCQDEIQFEDDCEPEPEKEECEESSTICSTETCQTTTPDPSPEELVTEPEEEKKEEPPLPPPKVEEEEDLEDVDPDLERLIINEFDSPRIVETDKPKVKAFYRHKPQLYSHDIPDSGGVETQFSSGLRHHYIADLLHKEQKITDDNPLTGTMLLLDPAKPEIPRPKKDNTLFVENKDVEREDVHLNETAYVQKVLKFEQEKMQKDLADREYRKKLSYTTYRTEPPANPQTIQTLFPPEKRNFKENTQFSHLKPRSGEKNIRYEDQLRDVFHPEEKAIALEDEQIMKTYIPMESWFDKHEQLLQYERTKKAFKPSKARKKKKTLFDKVKGKWAKFRRYFKPVPRPKELVVIGAGAKLNRWAKEHPEAVKTRHKRKTVAAAAKKLDDEQHEFRYD